MSLLLVALAIFAGWVAYTLWGFGAAAMLVAFLVLIALVEGRR